MFSENLQVAARTPLATLPLAKWTVICTYEQFWDSRLRGLTSEHVCTPFAKSSASLSPAGYLNDAGLATARLSCSAFTLRKLGPMQAGVKITGCDLLGRQIRGPDTGRLSPDATSMER